MLSAEEVRHAVDLQEVAAPFGKTERSSCCGKDVERLVSMSGNQVSHQSSHRLVEYPEVHAPGVWAAKGVIGLNFGQRRSKVEVD